MTPTTRERTLTLVIVHPDGRLTGYYQHPGPPPGGPPGHRLAELQPDAILIDFRPARAAEAHQLLAGGPLPHLATPAGWVWPVFDPPRPYRSGDRLHCLDYVATDVFAQLAELTGATVHQAGAAWTIARELLELDTDGGTAPPLTA